MVGSCGHGTPFGLMASCIWKWCCWTSQGRGFQEKSNMVHVFNKCLGSVISRTTFQYYALFLAISHVSGELFSSNTPCTCFNSVTGRSVIQYFLLCASSIFFNFLVTHFYLHLIFQWMDPVSQRSSYLEFFSLHWMDSGFYEGQ